MNPNSWIERNGGAAKIAPQTGISLPVFSRTLGGYKYPSFQIMWWLYRLSGGRVTLPDWIKLFEAKQLAGDAPPPSRVSAPGRVEKRRGRKKTSSR